MRPCQGTMRSTAMLVRVKTHFWGLEQNWSWGPWAYICSSSNNSVVLCIFEYFKTVLDTGSCSLINPRVPPLSPSDGKSSTITGISCIHVMPKTACASENLCEPHTDFGLYAYPKRCKTLLVGCTNLWTQVLTVSFPTVVTTYIIHHNST